MIKTIEQLNQEIYNDCMRRGVSLFYAGGYYYNGVLCAKVDEIPDGGKIIDIFNDAPYGHWYVYDNGFIRGETISGNKYLKIELESTNHGNQ